MRDMANIIELVLNADRREETDTRHILMEQNLREANFIKNLVWLKADPDYEEGMDENIDKILQETQLDNKILQGLKLASVMVLAFDRQSLIPNPATQFLVRLYDAANAILLESTDACDP